MTSYATSKKPGLSTNGIVRSRLIIFTILVGILGSKFIEAAEQDAISAVSESTGPAVKTMTGPWGKLEYFETMFVAPQSLVNMFPRPTTETIWRFPGWSRQQLMNALQQMPFRDGQLDWIDQLDGLFELDQEVRLYPTEEMIRDMSQSQRLAMHRLLAQWEENVSHRQPKIMTSFGDIATWFHAAGLPSDVANEIQSLCFEDGSTVLLTEVEFVMKRLDDEELQDKFLRALTRTQGLIVRLKITEDSDVPAIADYWRGYEKRKAISPILESIATTQGVDYLDIAHLLPPTPRMLLNTYPDPSLLRANESPDCTWTVVHFFRSEPSNRMLDRGAAVREIETMYEPTTDTAKFGDLLSFVRAEDGQPIHSAIHIAGDIAFTKNGNGLYVPWVLMRTPDILELYAKNGPIRIERLRIKTPEFDRAQP